MAVNLSPTAGNTIVVSVALIGGTTVIVQGISDNGANGGSLYYPREGKTNAGGSQERQEVWTTVAGGAAASVTQITVTLQLVGGGSATSKMVLNAADYSGVTAFGVASWFEGTSTAPTHDCSLSDANDIIIMGTSGGGTGTFTSSVGNLRSSGATTGASSVGGALTDNTSASAGNVTNTVTLSGSESWTTIVLELKAVSSITPGGYLVQGTLADIGGTDASSNTSATIVLNAPVGAGNLLVLAIRNNVEPITWTLPGIWTSTVSRNGGDANNQCGMWHVVNSAAGAVSVRANPSSSCGWTMFLAEYSLEATALDGATSNTGTSNTSLDSGGVTTSCPYDLVVSFCFGATALTKGAGFTSRNTDANYTAFMFEDQLVTTVGTYHGTATQSPAAAWIACVAVFKLTNPITFTTRTGSASSATAGTTLAVTVTINAGDTVVVACATVGTAIQAPTDNASGGSNVYVALSSSITNTVTVQEWICLKAKSATTVTMNNTSSRHSCVVACYSNGAWFLNGSTGSATSTNPTLATTQKTGDSWVVAAMAAQGTGAFTALTGNLRIQIAGAGSTTPAIAIVDNVSTAGSSVTCAGTHVSAAWAEASANIGAIPMPPVMPPPEMSTLLRM